MRAAGAMLAVIGSAILMGQGLGAGETPRIPLLVLGGVLAVTGGLLEILSRH